MEASTGQHEARSSSGDADPVISCPSGNDAATNQSSKNRAQSRPNVWRFGVAFRGLKCHGFISSTRYQQTVVSRALAIPRKLIRLAFAASRPPSRVQILHDFNGLLGAGEMLLVLGRPGSGCSTFLKVLAGDRHGIHLGEGSRVNYEGISYEQMHRDFNGETSYLAELDVHFPELTVGETLTFAASTRDTNPGPPHRGNEPRSLARRVSSLFNLDIAFDTKVGNALIRGISGGEKKRTSIAESFIGDAPLQCWDNSTRGLDSSTALGFVRLLRESASTSGRTILMSIYQASEHIYWSFDKVTLLYEGRQIFFGPVGEATDYFTRLGFSKPPQATTADFLTSLTNPAERSVLEGFEGKAPRSPDEFAAAWKQSPEARRLCEEIDAFNAAHPEKHKKKHNPLHSPRTFPIPISTQILICIQRGFIRLRNNYIPVVAGVIANTIIAIVIGSVFFNLPETTDSFDRRPMLLFFSLMVTAFAPAFEVLTMWTQRPIAEKHHRYAFYHPFAEGIASIICDLPNKITTAIMFHITLYFMTNLRREAGAFLIYLLFNFVVVVTMSMLFRMIGSVSKTIEQTMAPVSVVVVIIIAYTGFVIPADYMVSWLSWLRRVDPLSYAYESLMVNEFRNRSFPCSSIIPSGPMYDQYGTEGRVCSAIGSVPGEPEVQGSTYIAVRYGHDESRLWSNLGIIVAMMVIFCTVHLLATEYIPAERSRGEVLLFKRGQRPQRRRLSTSNSPARSGSEEVGGELKFAQDLVKIADGREDKNELCAPATDGILRQYKIFHWSGLRYQIKSHNGTKTILNDIEGWVKPGTVTALMGVTGAGKTSLLDVLADRAPAGTVTGDICIDGRVRTSGFQRRIGYVQQEDIHMASTTVREALEFSALLRQPSGVPAGEKLAYVESVLSILDMEPYADAVVGVPGEGLNLEQRKRLTIAVELVAKPELLVFLDEPTSGLDSQTAWSTAMLLRKLAESGQAILCTIHQPSSQLFELFDRLLLLSPKGETLYFGEIGPGASTVVSYFEAGGASPLPQGQNPVEWVMSTTSPASSAIGISLPSGIDSGEHPEEPFVKGTSPYTPTRWAAYWKESDQRKDVLLELENLKKTQHGRTSITGNWEAGLRCQPASFYSQMQLVSGRIFREYWRDPTYLTSKMSLCVGLALANGLSFLTTSSTPLDIQRLTNLIFSIFLLSQLFSTIDQQVIPRLVSARTLFEAREKRSLSYSWVVFLSSGILVELAWQTLGSVLVFVPWYYPSGLWRNHGDGGVFGTAERGALTFVLLWLFCLWIVTFSQVVAVGIEHAETSVQIATLFFWLSLVFCGVVVPPNKLPRFWIFVYRASPLTYLVNGLVVAGLGDAELICSATEFLRINLPSPGSSSSTSFARTCGEYLEPMAQAVGGYVENPGSTGECRYCPASTVNAVLGELGIEMGRRWENVGFLAVYVVFNVLATFGVYWVTRVPKRTRMA